MTDRKNSDALNEQELDQVTGGVQHELSHTVQQGSDKLTTTSGATSKGANAAQYNPETITRSFAPSGSTDPKR
ncbi:hypothetical protein [Sphingorhabdus sp. Alg231-15]|uniref:hypothetical protein n=1 Tax=Sphingorhabdus sp. Alg231-15 TaxID=1922222 RepID=UPI000D557F62